MSTESQKDPADLALRSSPGGSKGVRIFSYPKVIFLYPSFLVAIVCGLVMLFVPSPETRVVGRDAREAKAAQEADAKAAREAEEKAKADAAAAKGPDNANANAKGADNASAPASAPAPAKTPTKFATLENYVGLAFMAFLAINLLVMSLDFPRFTIIAGILLVMVVILFLVLLGEYLDLLKIFRFVFGNLHIEANATFYFVFATILGVIGTLVYLTRWLDYWEIYPNEILHHHGPWSDLERFPTINLRFDKEIPDIFEYIMLRSGRLVLSIQGEPKAIVLENVLNINRIEDSLKDMMGRLKVTMADSR